MKKLIKSFIYFIIFIALIIGGIGVYTYISLNSHLKLSSPFYLTINKNQSVESILDTLNTRKILTPSWLLKPYFKIYTKITGKKIYAGSYKFEKIHTNFDVIRALVHGIQNNMVKVTYPEGINIKEFAKITEDRLGSSAKDFIRLAYSDSLLKARHINAKSVEGYLMPATYIFFWEQTPAVVIDKLLDEHKEVWNSLFDDRAKALGKSIHEILTFASIIESETPVIEERKRVAGVYLNRLKKGMRLEADPTVQYAIGEKKKLTYNDLDSDNPYNTYKFKGLPPGPINSPSKTSIDAALDPELNNYIFFVAVGDGSGKHNFSVNFAQHKGFVKDYRKNRKK